MGKIKRKTAESVPSLLQNTKNKNANANFGCEAAEIWYCFLFLNLFEQLILFDILSNIL